MPARLCAAGFVRTPPAQPHQPPGSGKLGVVHLRRDDAPQPLRIDIALVQRTTQPEIGLHEVRRDTATLGIDQSGGELGIDVAPFGFCEHPRRGHRVVAQQIQSPKIGQCLSSDAAGHPP